MQRSARTSWIIWFCIALHLWWGAMLLIEPATRGVTAIHLITRVSGSTTVAAIIFIVVALSAMVGLLRSRAGTTSGLLEVLPQQSVLILSAFGACAAIWNGAYADGEPRPRAFIAADQAPALFIMLAHTASLLDHFIPRARLP